jgi:hypothetical protein
MDPITILGTIAITDLVYAKIISNRMLDESDSYIVNVVLNILIAKSVLNLVPAYLVDIYMSIRKLEQRVDAMTNENEDGDENGDEEVTVTTVTTITTTTNKTIEESSTEESESDESSSSEDSSSSTEDASSSTEDSEDAEDDE